MKYIIASLLVTTFWGCEEKKASLGHFQTLNDGEPVRLIKGAKVVLSDSGRKTSTLMIPVIASYEKGDSVIVKADSGVRVHFFDKNGRRMSILTSKRGILHENNDMEVMDNVLIKTRDSITVKTSYMKWYNTESLARSPKKVEVIKPNERITGIGFESDAGIQNYRIFKVTGIIEFDEGEQF